MSPKSAFFSRPISPEDGPAKFLVQEIWGTGGMMVCMQRGLKTHITSRYGPSSTAIFCRWKHVIIKASIESSTTGTSALRSSH